jgi:hypothetical protein
MAKVHNFSGEIHIFFPYRGRYSAFSICYYLLLTDTHRIFAIIEDALDGRPQTSPAEKVGVFIIARYHFEGKS